MSGPSMSPQVFSILSALVAERAGLHFDAASAALFSDKVAVRAAEAGFNSLLDYYYFLRYDPAGTTELDALVEALVVNETYLFRELAPVETLLSQIVLPLLEGGRRPRIWCAACATGEEPLTMAMLLAARGALDKVDILASDVSAAALERARSGRFARRALRQPIPEFAARWLEVDERGIAVPPRLTNAIAWQQINLMDEAAIGALGTFDAVLCRNVLIYFNDATIRRVVDRLAARLRIGGALLVGVSESLLRFGTSLTCEEQNGVFLYKRTV